LCSGCGRAIGGGRSSYWTGGSFSDGNTDDRGYTFMFAVANQAQGNHTGTIGMFSGTGAVIHTKALMYNWVALG